MTNSSTTQNTTVGIIDSEVLAFTAGRDVELDLHLVEADCLSTAAHVKMLYQLPLQHPLFTGEELKKVLNQLTQIIQEARDGNFEISMEDQDVHLAVERYLTSALGEVGKKIHTARSRNDQISVDLRIYGKIQLLKILEATGLLADQLLSCGEKHIKTPMVGRTHMQPAMPSSVGLWASAFAEELMEDMRRLFHAYSENDKSPLGSAAGYGTSFPIDRQTVSDLLGFEAPCYNVLAACNARGKLEGVILSSLSLLMLTLSRMAQDLMLFTMPEFAYFTLPPECCTGSSIMPNKKNPDLLELIRAKAAGMWADTQCVAGIMTAAPSGYNRDVQETKEPFIKGLRNTLASVQILTRCFQGLSVNTQRLLDAFTPEIFATDFAMEQVSKGIPFREAYQHVKQHLNELESQDPKKVIEKRTHWGGIAGLDFPYYKKELAILQERIKNKNLHFNHKRKSLLRE